MVDQEKQDHLEDKDNHLQDNKNTIENRDTELEQQEEDNKNIVMEEVRNNLKNLEQETIWWKLTHEVSNAHEQQNNAIIDSHHELIELEKNISHDSHARHIDQHTTWNNLYNSNNTSEIYPSLETIYQNKISAANRVKDIRNKTTTQQENNNSIVNFLTRTTKRLGKKAE